MKEATFSTNKDGNDMLHIARNPDGTLQPIVAARLPFGDLQLFKLLLQTERPGGRFYETGPDGGYFFAYDNTAKRPYPSVMIWKYSVIDGKYIIGDMGQEDLGIVRYAVETFLTPEEDENK